MGDRLGTPGAVGFFGYKMAKNEYFWKFSSVILSSIELKYMIHRSISDHWKLEIGNWKLEIGNFQLFQISNFFNTFHQFYNQKTSNFQRENVFNLKV